MDSLCPTPLLMIVGVKNRRTGMSSGAMTKGIFMRAAFLKVLSFVLLLGAVPIARFSRLFNLAPHPKPSARLGVARAPEAARLSDLMWPALDRRDSYAMAGRLGLSRAKSGYVGLSRVKSGKKFFSGEVMRGIGGDG